MRIVLENVLLFLLPTLIFCGITYIRREPKPAVGQVLNEAPLVLLFVCGVVLVGGLRIYAAATADSGRPDQEYVPPHMGKDGKIEPGRMK